jgi:hypothetical protein
VDTHKAESPGEFRSSEIGSEGFSSLASSVRNRQVIGSSPIVGSGGRQIISLIYVGPTGTERSADVNRFVSSLRIAR